MTQTRRLSLFIIVSLVTLYNESHSQPIRRQPTRRRPNQEQSWIQNTEFPSGGIVLVRDGRLQLSETPPTMQNYGNEGFSLTLRDVNDALRTICGVIEQKEVSGLDKNEKSRLANEIQNLTEYVQRVPSSQPRYRSRKMNKEGDNLEGHYSQGVEINKNRRKKLFHSRNYRKRFLERATTSRHELSRLLIFLIDHTVEMTPIIRETISYWKRLLDPYWRNFETDRNKKSRRRTTGASAASADEGEAIHAANPADLPQQQMDAAHHDAQSSQTMAFGYRAPQSQQAMNAVYHDAQSSQAMAFGYRAPQSQQAMDAVYHDAQSSQPMASGYQAPQSQQPMDAAHHDVRSSQTIVSGYEAPQSQEPMDAGKHDAQSSQQMLSGYQAPQSQQLMSADNHGKQTNQQHHTEINSNHIVDPAALPVLPQDFVSRYLGSLPSNQPMLSGYQPVQSHQPIVLPPISSFLEPPPPRHT